MFECINTFNHKPFSIALSAFSSKIDVDDEVEKTFLKRRILPKNKTLPRKYIVHTKNAKENKRNNNAKLIKRKTSYETRTCQTVRLLIKLITN